MSRAKGEGAGRGAGEDRGKPPGGGAKGTHSNHVPTFMRDKARLEISKKFPQGSREFRRYCYNYHDPFNSCDKPNGRMSQSAR